MQGGIGIQRDAGSALNAAMYNQFVFPGSQ